MLSAYFFNVFNFALDSIESTNWVNGFWIISTIELITYFFQLIEAPKWFKKPLSVIFFASKLSNKIFNIIFGYLNHFSSASLSLLKSAFS